MIKKDVGSLPGKTQCVDDAADVAVGEDKVEELGDLQVTDFYDRFRPLVITSLSWRASVRSTSQAATP